MRKMVEMKSQSVRAKSLIRKRTCSYIVSPNLLHLPNLPSKAKLVHTAEVLPE